MIYGNVARRLSLARLKTLFLLYLGHVQRTIGSTTFNSPDRRIRENEMLHYHTALCSVSFEAHHLRSIFQTITMIFLYIGMISAQRYTHISQATRIGLLPLLYFAIAVILLGLSGDGNKDSYFTKNGYETLRNYIIWPMAN